MPGNYSTLISQIQNAIYTNNQKAITGNILQTQLLNMISALGAGYQWVGVATPTSPGTAQQPDFKCFYVATEPGTYQYLGSLQVADGEVAFLYWDTAWHKLVPDIATATSVSQLGHKAYPLLGGDYAPYLKSTPFFVDAYTWLLARNDYTGFLIPAYPGQKVKIAASSDHVARFTFVKDTNIINGAAVNFADGYASNITLQAGTDSGWVETPANATYLWIMMKNGGNDRSPASVVFMPADIKKEKAYIDQAIGVDNDTEIDLSISPRMPVYINSSGNVAINNGSYSILIPIEHSGDFWITADSTNAEYGILKSGSLIYGSAVEFATVGGILETGLHTIRAGYTEVVTIDDASDAKYFYFRADDATKKKPAKIVKINELNAKAIRVAGVDYTKYLFNQYIYIDGTPGTWKTNGNGYEGNLIPVLPGQRVKITADDSVNAAYAFVQQQAIVHGASILYADGYSGKVSITAGSDSGVIAAPTNAAYLWVLTKVNGINRTPKKLEFIAASYPLDEEFRTGIIGQNMTKDAAFRSTGVKARDTDIKPLSFLHISDIHTRAVDYKCFLRACQFLEHYSNIAFGIVTGDLVYDSFADPMTYYDLGLAETTKPVFNVIGNHDAGQYKPAIGLPSVGSDAEVYARYIEPYISGWGLKTDGSGTPHPTGKSYYFTDFTDEKIRLIVICEFESDMTIDPSDPNKYLYSREYRSMRQAQVDWFIQSLSTTPSDYGVVVAFHQPNELKDEDNPFVSDSLINTSRTASIYTDTADRGWLIRIIDAFRSKSSLSFSFSQTGGVVGTINVSADFTGLTSEFICVLAGHVHNDYVGYFHSYPDVLVLAVGADNLTYTGKYCQRAAGTPSEDLFNVVQIDRTRKQITILRVGADASITGQDRRRIQIDY